jgi:hypothetical protein
MNEIKVPVSPGELLDKITILRIKSARMRDTSKLANVRTELEALERIWNASPYAAVDVASDVSALLAVNQRLWAIEDDIRRPSMAISCGWRARYTSRTTSARRSSDG